MREVIQIGDTLKVAVFISLQGVTQQEQTSCRTAVKFYITSILLFATVISAILAGLTFFQIHITVRIWISLKES